MKFPFVIVEQLKSGLQRVGVERNKAEYIPVFFFLQTFIHYCADYKQDALLLRRILLPGYFSTQASQKEANSHEPSRGFHTCIERLCFGKRELAFLCLCASDLFVFMCAVFVQPGLAVFVTHLLLLCAVICVRSLAPR